MPLNVRPPKLHPDYTWLWGIVDAAVKEALTTHPNYVPNEELVPYVRLSINKRVVGRVLGELRWNAKSRLERWKTEKVG